MSRRGSSTWRAGTALLVALMCLAQVQAVQASAGVLWRTATVSWDDPATQLVDAAALESVPHADAAGPTAVQAPRAPARLVLPGTPSVSPWLTVALHVPRSPPAA